jgi:hypothetical protein
MKIKSEKQFSKLHEPSAEGAPVVCRLIRRNTENILPRLVGARRSRTSGLRRFGMMGTFVDLAWDTDSVQTVLKTERPSSPENFQPMAQRTSNPATSVRHQ